MLFHSQIFLLAFLPLTLVLYYSCAHQQVARQRILIAASLFFYGWWDVRFVPLLIGQVCFSWVLIGVYFTYCVRWPLWLGVAGNLSVLGLFKYLDFFTGIIEQALGKALPRANLILPIGISFYTFQLVSYLVDTMRGGAPRYDLRQLTLFVVLFPHLIAGPIVRHNEIMPQFAGDPLRPGAAERISRGLALLIAGVGVKVFIADRLAKIADPVFTTAQVQIPTIADATAGTLAFGLQIFCDFASYSDMAIGLALMLGLHFPRNFEQPYRAKNLREFWWRWHMTLSRFLRDYIYIPFGGSREGPGRLALATLVTMGLCGLWHGAGWTFIIWGLAHGVGLLVCRLWDRAALPMPALLGWLLTFVFAITLFGLFRAPDLGTAYYLGAGLLGGAGWGKHWKLATLFPLLVGCCIALMPVTIKEALDRWLVPARLSAAALAAAAFYAVLVVGEGQPKSFIYFQF